MVCGLISSAAAGVTVPADQRSSVSASREPTTTITIPATIKPDYLTLFRKFDRALNDGDGVSNMDNSHGHLAWMQSYLMQGYMAMWRATGDTYYLDAISNQFARVLECRDDRVQRNDVYTGAPRKGWGTAYYDKKGWHVFAVHTGMICLGPVEFVREVKSSATLEQMYGTTATLFLSEIEDMMAEACQDFVTTSSGEGWFTDPGMNGIIPLNQSNAPGCVLVELYRITGKEEYKSRVTALATYFRNCLRRGPDNTWNWAYWPRTSDQHIKRGEDISHAAINIDFALRCHKAEIVFTDTDLKGFGATWLYKVRRSNGDWSGFVDGTRAEHPEAYRPQAGGRWLSLVPYLDKANGQAIVHDVAKAFAGSDVITPSRALGIANLALYGSEAGLN